MSARLMFAHRRYTSAFRQSILDTERHLAAQRRLRGDRARVKADMVSYHEPQAGPVDETPQWSDSFDRYSDTFFVGVAVGILCSIAFMGVYGGAATNPTVREMVPPEKQKKKKKKKKKEKAAAIGEKREFE